jgi:bacteriorhodopsin
MVEFYLILAAVGVVAGRVFWHLLIGTLIMLLGGYFGETGVLAPVVGFVIGMAGWVYILYYIFSGEAAKSAESAPAAVQSAFKTMRLIVLVGWAIYPLGYVFGYMIPTVDAAALNGIYNVADFVNKIAFGLMIWSAANSST